MISLLPNLGIPAFRSLAGGFRAIIAFSLMVPISPLFAQKPGAAEEKANRVVRIVTAGDPKRAIEAPKAGLAGSSRTGTGFRLIAGLANPEMFSFESTRSKGTYLRHHLWKIEVAERPDDPIMQKDFDWEATFKIVKVEGDVVMLEAGNRPGEFITIEPEGRYALAPGKNEPLRTQFKLIDK